MTELWDNVPVVISPAALNSASLHLFDRYIKMRDAWDVTPGFYQWLSELIILHMTKHIKQETKGRVYQFSGDFEEYRWNVETMEDGTFVLLRLVLPSEVPEEQKQTRPEATPKSTSVADRIADRAPTSNTEDYEQLPDDGMGEPPF